jgi:hypothetical protein
MRKYEMKIPGLNKLSCALLFLRYRNFEQRRDWALKFDKSVNCFDNAYPSESLVYTFELHFHSIFYTQQNHLYFHRI